ncbi:hypothetical protein J437_LFUL000258 [Ladona fulva]|uniref:DUF1279 domain-containing protein n=1 Tax=Ladona fulva TaxID=123851 RepID=A0A8K0NV37_LADFU|nr:hypothetical protein J437_LFUL000258 [Ladona fulva]
MNFYTIHFSKVRSIYSSRKCVPKFLRVSSVGVPSFDGRYFCHNGKKKTALSGKGWLSSPPLLSSFPKSPFLNHLVLYSNDAGKGSSTDNEEKKPTLLQRFKQMYRDYWYVLVPVHVATSIVWYGSFYYIAKSGVDVPALLESMGLSESIVSPLRDSSAGHLAVAYAMYKVATPARYTVTLGGTTISINYLKQWGYIKPIPPKEKLKELYAEKVESYREKKEQMVESYREKKESVRSGLQEAKESITHGFRQSLAPKNTNDAEKKVPDDKKKNVSNCDHKDR